MVLRSIRHEISRHIDVTTVAVQRWTKRWTCFAKQQPGRNFSQPRAHLLVNPCTLARSCAPTSQQTKLPAKEKSLSKFSRPRKRPSESYQLVPSSKKVGGQTAGQASERASIQRATPQTTTSTITSNFLHLSLPPQPQSKCPNAKTVLSDQDFLIP